LRKNRFVTTAVALVGVGIVCGLFRFNYNPALYGDLYDRYLIVNMLALIWVPMATILLIFRADPATFGFSMVSSRRVWAVTAALFAGLLVLIVIVAHRPAFQSYYPIFRWFRGFEPAFADYPRTNPFAAAPWLMVYAETSYGMYLFCWEFFFRGFLLFGLQRSLGSVAAVVLQALAFGLLHWGKPEMLPSFAGGVILGILALKAKSFLPAFVLHWAASISLDVLVVAFRPH
jgi:membrane protease YdiL (CAAX protease family)